MNMVEQPEIIPSNRQRTTKAQGFVWSLVVSTFKREKVLPRCVRCAIASSRRPTEVIIVDASPYWQTTRDAVLGEFEAANPDINFVYVGAHRASLTAQRNQGLDLATGDIAFMLDDDSLLFPDSAEQIMAVYDADVNKQVVALTPIFVPQVPDAHLNLITPGHPTQGHVSGDESRANPLRKIMRKLLWSQLQLLPYDGQEGIKSIPEHLRKFNLIPTRFSTGSATFRTNAVRAARFEEVLERYAAGEDWDISERIKQHGLIAFCPASHQCHLEAPGGRLAREVVFTLRYLNFMALHVLHSTDVGRSRRLYRRFLWRRVLSELLADLTKFRWRIPRAQGTWRALRMLPFMFAKSKEEMRTWYPQFQRELIAESAREDSAR
jgi:glycosyltransferase involved in cell wall biosynthesis